MKANTFWISTVPRTGSMWLYNTTREILKISKFNVLPNQIPQQEIEFFEIFNKESLLDTNNINKYVFKVHNILKPDFPKSKILTTIRDPREICLSFKEFMRTDFNSAFTAAKNITKFEKEYKNYDKNYLRFFRYENIEKKPIETILDIADFINCKISTKDAENISTKYNKNSVRQLIKTNDEKLLHKIKNKEKINNTEIVYFSKDNYRSFDLYTGFQTNHVSNRVGGDWKNFFSQNEIELMNSEFKDFLEEYLYS